MADAVDSPGVSQTNGAAVYPYEAPPDSIPKDDPYLSRSVHYGRYAPSDGDFKPRYDQWHEPEDESLSYWEDVVKTYCTAENSLGEPGSRAAYAAGSLIIRVDQETADDAAVERFSCVNANEEWSARNAEDTLKEMGIAVPVIYFYGTIDGKNVTVESRIPGVSLEVAWRYLAPEQIHSFKRQTHRLLRLLGAIECSYDGASYVCRELNSQPQPDVTEAEREILFRDKAGDEQLCFAHNNLTRSNIIVKGDRIVGVTGWRQSGFFGYRRASMVHEQFRTPEASFLGSQEDALGWADIYNKIFESSADEPIHVKTEASGDSFAVNGLKPGMAQLDGIDSPDDHPTTKKIANLKRESVSRASSSDRSSPVAATKAPKKPGPGATKKGTATKKPPATKKRKLNEADQAGVDGRRSNTPVLARNGKGPRSKKQGSASIAGSPAPEGKRRGTKDPAAENEDDEEGAEDDEEDDISDPDVVFCICRKPDNHTWMIACDGECEDWFHGKCVNIHPRDADLIEKYICPNCHEKGKGRTSWKPMCRLPECRKPARVRASPPSKYCSDDHGREFMLRKTQHLNLGPTLRKGRPASIVSSRFKGRGRDGHSTDGDPDDSHAEEISNDDEEGEMDLEGRALDELGSRGGTLTAAELKAVVSGVSSVEEFHKLGERLVSPPPEEGEEKEIGSETNNENKPEGETKASANGSKKLGLDIDAKGLTYSADEAAKIDKLRKWRDELLHRKQMLSARSAFIVLVRHRTKSILERLKQTDPKGGWKDICGFDARLAWSDDEFDEWRLSEPGNKALKEGTPESLAASYPDSSTDADGDVAMADTNKDDLASFARGVCLKKRCERHKQWVKVQQQDIQFEESTVRQDLTRCEQDAQAVVERAVLRIWAETDGAGA
ncbi:hypothetical protein ASPZODRAFT_12492 [Penicilliopsis zonata CBS 506.65]|uniref:PHD-type domain-containing protein n=1 Tax=Penicilliopsis zonata CBS 506.65 TaxID=1073090 RepID=A0A1L9SWZ2_9EURO|nr:hypothetical protein ASPZODRAFT_12492 [Penicilliopsis zonata CBS 506.65]OJJ51679.1 hypothetical protein ASPZODRAFT_12492 [Penicilliopsis zonata CBS 506.65]